MSSAKIIKNPKRQQSKTVEKYTPQYKILEISPKEMKFNTVDQNATIVNTFPKDVNIRKKTSGFQQPINEDKNVLIGVGNQPILNIGNNMDAAWIGPDSIIDDLETNQSIIDNNDFIDVDKLQLKSNLFKEEKLKEESIEVDDNFNGFSSLKENDYLLLIGDNILCSGNLNIIQDELRKLIFGTHEICDGEPVSVENISVIKKIPIKVGVFIQD